MQFIVALVVDYCKCLSGNQPSVISAAMHLLVLSLLLGFPSFAQFCYGEVDILPQLHGKSFAQAGTRMEEGRTKHKPVFTHT